MVWKIEVDAYVSLLFCVHTGSVMVDSFSKGFCGFSNILLFTFGTCN